MKHQSLTVRKLTIAVVVMIACILCPIHVLAQKEKNIWYFGNLAGLNFNTTPPTILANSAMYTAYSCGSAADANGNLLFYTNGLSIWNKQHQVMANGTGLQSCTNYYSHSGLTLKKPGSSTLYYVFTLDCPSGNMGPSNFRYSIVDMSLAAGLGSVTVKNAPIYSPAAGKIAAVRHCNGIDAWVVTHEMNTNVFRAYLLTAAGLSTVPVISAIGAAYTAGNWGGTIRVSQNGQRLAISATGQNVCDFDVFDFDATSGVISNDINLLNINDNMTGAWGLEFSPDATKLYGALWGSGYPGIFQWDLCAGSPAAMAASINTLSSTLGISRGELQLGPDNKIYIARWFKPELAVINNPNALGSACNYSETGQSVASNSCITGLPNFISEINKVPLPPFGSGMSACNTLTFSLPATPGFTLSGCASNGYSLVGQQWDFGDPGSGSNNVSLSATPMHTFTATGTYTVRLVLYYTCGVTNDTLKQQVVVPGPPVIGITGKTNVCQGGSTSITATGATSYTWSTGVQSASVVLTPSTTTIYTVTGAVGSCTATKVFAVTTSKCTGIEETLENFTSFDFYPNPAHDHFTLNVSRSGILSIYDVVGNLLSQQLVSAGETELKLDAVTPGLYLLTFRSDFGLESRRLVVERE